MSCGEPHDTRCQDVLGQLNEYLDGELDEEMVARIVAHLDECGPCLEEHEREAVVLALVRRSCACEAAPDALRMKILAQITAVYPTGCPSSARQV